MKKQFLEGRIESLGERKPIMGKDVRFKHIAIRDASGATTAVSNVIVEPMLANSLRVGEDVKLAFATHRRLSGGKVNYLVAIRRPLGVEVAQDWPVLTYVVLATLSILAAFFVGSFGFYIIAAIPTAFALLFVYAGVNFKLQNVFSQEAYEGFLKRT